jgi:transposase
MTDEEMRLTRLVADQGAQIYRLTNNERVHKLVLEQIKHDLKQERASIVAYLRAPGTSCSPDVQADAIERGIHRTKDYPLGFNVWEREKP